MGRNRLGLVAPIGTPEPVADRLDAEIRRVLPKPEIRDAWTKRGAVPVATTPDGFNRSLRADIDERAEAVTAAGAKVQ